MADERRASPRIEILGRLHGHLVSLDVAVTVREISLGGMAIETPIAFPIGAVHEFMLTLGDGSTVPLTGQVVHCRNVAAPDADPSYVSGVRFLDDELPGGLPPGDTIIQKLG
jgi:hypothetical protein